MKDILMLGLGLAAGVTIGIFIMAMFFTSKKADFDHEKLIAYKDGYQKGYEDACSVQTSPTK